MKPSTERKASRQFLTMAAVAAELSISLAHAYNLVYSGDLCAVNLAPSSSSRKLYRVERERLDEFVDRRKVAAAAAMKPIKTHWQSHLSPSLIPKKDHLGLMPKENHLGL